MSSVFALFCAYQNSANTHSHSRAIIKFAIQNTFYDTITANCTRPHDKGGGAIEDMYKRTIKMPAVCERRALSRQQHHGWTMLSFDSSQSVYVEMVFFSEWCTRDNRFVSLFSGLFNMQHIFRGFALSLSSSNSRSVSGCHLATAARGTEVRETHEFYIGYKIYHFVRALPNAYLNMKCVCFFQQSQWGRTKECVGLNEFSKNGFALFRSAKNDFSILLIYRNFGNFEINGVINEGANKAMP